MSPRAARGAAPSPFTLLELLAVIVVLSVLAAIAAPRLGSFNESLKLNSCVRSFALLSEAARVESGLRGSHCRLVVQPGWRRLFLEAVKSPPVNSPREAGFLAENGSSDLRFAPLEGAFASFDLPEGVSIERLSVSGRRRSPLLKTAIDFDSLREEDEVDVVFVSAAKEFKGLRLEAGSGVPRELKVVRSY